MILLFLFQFNAQEKYLLHSDVNNSPLKEKAKEKTTIFSDLSYHLSEKAASSHKHINAFSAV